MFLEMTMDFVVSVGAESEADVAIGPWSSLLWFGGRTAAATTTPAATEAIATGAIATATITTTNAPFSGRTS